MKTKCRISFLFVILSWVTLWSEISFSQTNTFPSTGAAGIGTVTPDVSSLLEIKSTTKGVLIPRMTKLKRDSIHTPATGLLIYQTNSTPGFYYYSGTAWTAISTKGASLKLSNLTAPTAVNVDLLPGSNNSIDLGSSALGWRNVYAAGSYYIGSFKVLDAGTSNTFVGVTSNTSNTGSNNTAVGSNALRFNSSGGYNTATGAFALYSNTTTSNNTAFGYGSLYTNSSGSNNTATGAYALAYNSSGSGNTAIGYYALNHNNIGTSNTASGNNALNANTEGSNNTATGADALSTNSTGYLNTATGSAALNANTTGFYNTANGGNALKSNVGGVANTATGAFALYTNSSGSYNSAHGPSALANNTTGTDNTANGGNALAQNTTGNYNTASGYGALQSDTTGNHNTGFGYYADVSSGGLTNATVIGDQAVVDASNKVRIGNDNVNSIGGKVGWTTFPSDGRYKKNIKEDVQGLPFINSLKPITYTVDMEKLNAYFDKNRKHDEAFEKMKKDRQPATDEASRIVYNGFIAQDVEAAAKKLNYNFSGVDKPKTEDGLYGLRYADFVVPLVKAVQELSKMNNDKDAVIQQQNKKIDDLETRLSKLEAMMRPVSSN